MLQPLHVKVNQSSFIVNADVHSYNASNRDNLVVKSNRHGNKHLESEFQLKPLTPPPPHNLN